MSGTWVTVSCAECPAIQVLLEPANMPFVVRLIDVFWVYIRPYYYCPEHGDQALDAAARPDGSATAASRSGDGQQHP